MWPATTSRWKSYLSQLKVGGLLTAAFTALIAQASAAAPTAPQGVITAKGFLNIGAGTTIADLTGNAKFPDSPDVTFYYPYFEWNATGDINTPANNAYGDNYGAQMLGYFYPPATGDYVFWICSDDVSNLYLSTDDTAANKKLIAQEQGWSNARVWDTASSGDATTKCSQTFANTAWATKDAAGGAKITLTKGNAYYIEVLFKEGGGGDNVAVAVAAPDGSIDQTLPIPGQYLASIDKTVGPLKIVTQPQGQTVAPLAAVTFSVVVDGTPPYTYQWKQNGTDIAGATNATYSIARAATTDNGAKFTCAITGAQGSLTSAEAVLVVTSDPVPPTLVAANASATFDSVTVTFSEPVDPTTAEAVANYAISGGLTISSASLYAPSGSAGDNKVLLKTSKQTEGASYTLTVNKVKDLAGNVLATDSKVDFKGFVFVPGSVFHKFWTDVTTTSIAALTGDARFPDKPTSTSVLPRFEYPLDASNEAGSYYGNQLFAWFMPPKSGDYVFFVCSDDYSNLYLSTDDNPANKVLIAQESGWSNQRNWLTAGSGDGTTKRSDQFAATEWPTQGTITLQAGKRYYMEVDHVEGSGGDSAEVTYIMAGENDPADGDVPKTSGSVVGVYLDPTGAAIAIGEQPKNVTTVANTVATFSVAATGTSLYGTNLTYQWQKAAAGSTTFTDVAGATEAAYTTPFLTAANNGEKYRVAISRPPISQNSEEALLTVTSDSIPPTIASIAGNPSQLELTVRFSEPLDSASATALGNYACDKGLTISKAVLQNQSEVVLTTSQQTEGTQYTLTVNNVKDLAGNAIVANTVGSFNPATVATGVVAYWGLDGDFKDWNKKFDGTGYGTSPIEFVNGKAGFGKAIKLLGPSDSGGADQYVEITGGDPDDLAFAGGSMSVALWFTADAWDKSWQAVAAKGESSNWRIHRNNANDQMSWTGGSAGDTPVGTTSVNDGAWHHLVAVKDAAANTSYIWIDGALESKLEAVGALAANGHRMMIGENPDARNRYWHGSIDDVAVWNRPLLSTEIAKLYASGAGKPLSTFLPVPVSDPQLSVKLSNGKVVISWAAGSLVSSPTVKGTYAPVSGAMSPFTVTPEAGKATFYQVAQ